MSLHLQQGCRQPTEQHWKQGKYRQHSFPLPRNLKGDTMNNHGRYSVLLDFSHFFPSLSLYPMAPVSLTPLIICSCLMHMRVSPHCPLFFVIVVFHKTIFVYSPKTLTRVLSVLSLLPHDSFTEPKSLEEAARLSIILGRYRGIQVCGSNILPAV